MAMPYVIRLILNFIAAIFQFIFMIIFLVIWLATTVTLTGPLVQYLLKRNHDDVLLNREALLNSHEDLKLVTIPANKHSAHPNEFQVMVRHTKPKEKKYKYVCVIPNGLGATFITISNIHERLVEEGFEVISFDRMGVGLSDNNNTGRVSTAHDVITEMQIIIDACIPPQTKIILLGPSMGSVVAQCYLSLYSNRVVGFLNFDGLPYPFVKHRASFEKAKIVYDIVSLVVWTGVIRFGLFFGLQDPKVINWIISKGFDAKIIKAQMNQKHFFGNLGAEMLTMMSCCEFVNEAWGAQSVLELNDEDLKVMYSVEPDECVEIDEQGDTTKERKITSFRSESDPKAWISNDKVRECVEKMKNNKLEKAISADDVKIDLNEIGNIILLAEGWRNLVVRVLSARNHDFKNPTANKFYNQNMRDLSSAEHNQHCLFAKDGKRTIYPKLSHGELPKQLNEVVMKMKEIGDILENEVI